MSWHVITRSESESGSESESESDFSGLGVRDSGFPLQGAHSSFLKAALCDPSLRGAASASLRGENGRRVDTGAEGRGRTGQRAVACGARVRQLGSRATHLSPNSHALQRELSYPVLPLDLMDGPLENRRPVVYVKRPSGEKELARYGLDMFRRAEVAINRPLLVVRQDASTFDVTISAVQAFDWLDALEDDTDDLSLQIVPAGSYSYRQTKIGTLIRTLMSCHHAYTKPLMRCGIVSPVVRVAAVVIPRVMYEGEPHLIITQRVTRHKGGTYNGLWVFPGGHVEARESLEAGASREFMEETGLSVKPATLKLRACWQEVLPSRELQFLMLVYSADALTGPAGFDWSNLNLQKEEVAKLALLPESTWLAVANHGDCGDVEVPAVAFMEEDEEGNSVGEFRRTSVRCNEITGFNLAYGHGIGSAHRYALMQYLDPFDKHLSSTSYSVHEGPLAALMRVRSEEPMSGSVDSWEDQIGLEEEEEDNDENGNENEMEEEDEKRRISSRSGLSSSRGRLSSRFQDKDIPGSPAILVSSPEDLPV
ncbi:Nucleoside diphosphate-linked moiety X motif 17 [Hondaea fermentalgiana]|uniref:Nucleoside diphosphate-linked moiety X motif 17 n=1 Tax=Hondaea fermentalgiana TaxID=2315210 RepID=A0A2R5GR01_9STRA|nr:Nucleoside diphosphate-linked moiety X motif 17 [Hondaea fermentalgiana]|eukprot:GBG32739.1 Nucleoside diphosphate-linked moiety X motif 17 [Hondaea fermentalgiana]